MSLPLVTTSEVTGTGWEYTSSATAHAFSFTTTRSNQVLLLTVVNSTASPANFFTVASVTGAGLTWNLYRRQGVASGAVNVTTPGATGGLGLEVWWAHAPSPITAQTITVTMSGQPSRGGISLSGVTRCLTPSAPWDAGAGLPVVTAGAYPNAATVTLSQRVALFLRFRATSFNPVNSETNTPAITWNGFNGSLASGGNYFETGASQESLSPVLPRPPAPIASGCDPRTPTSLTASWAAVSPVQYPLRVGESHTVSNSGPGVCVSIYGALVGAPLGNLITYHVQYERTDGTGDPVDTYGIDALTTELTDLDDGAAYTWLVSAVDTAGDEGDFSDDVVCSFGPSPPTPEAAPFENLIWLRWSDDAGHTWSNPVSQRMGAIGAYRTSLNWNRLGMARNRVFEISWSSPTATALQGCYFEVTPGSS